MPRMSLSRHLLTALVFCLGLTAVASCGYNPKESSGGPSSNLGFKGTVECLYSGCHDSITATEGSYPGFNPVTSWALAGHGNINALPTTTEGLTTECADCHDPASDLVDDEAFLFTTSAPPVSGTALAAVGLTPRPMIGCEGCHGSGSEHYAYAGTTLVIGNHRFPLDSTISPIYGNPNHLTSCGPCHSPDKHAGGSSAGNILANQFSEWFGNDGTEIFNDDGHSDSLVVETVQGTMTSVLTRPIQDLPCAVCHTVEGFVRFFAHDDTGWAASQTEIDRIISETGDTDVTNPSFSPGTAALSQVSCVSCHPSHEQGNVIRQNIHDYPGALSDTQKRATLCMSCHNVRLLQSAIGSGQTGTSGLEIPRHPQKEVFEGVKNSANDSLRGVEFPGFSPVDSDHAGTDNIPDACAGCHYVTVTDADLTDFPQKATTGHAFSPRLEGCLLTFTGCHLTTDFLLADGTTASYEDSTIASFDFGSIYYSIVGQPGTDHDGDGNVEPFQDEVQGMLDDLRGKIQGAGGSFDSTLGLFDLEGMAALSTTVRAAAYNYDYIVGDRSLGYHNPLYVVNLLAVSISALP